MLGLLIVFFCGAIVSAWSYNEWGTAWGIICGAVAMILTWAVLGLLLRRRMSAQQQKIQDIMQAAQIKINRQLEMFQRRPPSSEKAARQIMEKIQFEAVRKSLEELDSFKKFYKWNPVLFKQINTMKMQLYYQLREYGKVDELLPKCMLFDSQSVAIKLARMFKKEDNGLDKFFKSKIRRFRGDERAYLASVYAWIKLKQDDSSNALDALLEAKKLSDNQVLLDNIEKLTNGKVRHYSNSGFGDIWYALSLEEPKMKTQRQYVGRGF